MLDWNSVGTLHAKASLNQRQLNGRENNLRISIHIIPRDNQRDVTIIKLHYNITIIKLKTKKKLKKIPKIL